MKGEKGRGRRLRHRLEVALYRAVNGAFRALPHAAARSLGRGLGDLFFLAAGRRRRVALANLAIAFPQLPAADRRRLARASFRHLGLVLADTLSASRFDLPELCRRLTLEGWEHLQQARARPGGLLALTAHLGCWEIAAWVTGAYFGPLHVVFRPLDNRTLDRELTALRGRFGNAMIPKRGALKGMTKALAAGEMVGILIDQRVEERNGILVPFFGQPALTSPLLAHLSLRRGIPVVPIFCHPEPRGRYRFVVHPPVEPGEVAPGEGAAEALTRRYLEVIEAEIRARPATWMWAHQRWRLTGRGTREG